MRIVHLDPSFVEFIPDDIEPGLLYVSMAYSVVVHLCACGCGRKTVTPLSPADWKLTFDGRNVSLRPSIGNWAYPCRSHYWIVDGDVRWAPDMSEEEVAYTRRHNRDDKALFYGESSDRAPKEIQVVGTSGDGSSKGISAAITRLFGRWYSKR